MTKADDIFLWIFIPVFLGLIVVIFCGLWVGYRYKKVLAECFKNSPAIRQHVPDLFCSPHYVLTFLGTIMGCVAFPDFHVRHGAVSAEDLKNLPEHLRRKLILLSYFLAVAMTSFLLAMAIWKLGIIDWLGSF